MIAGRRTDDSLETPRVLSPLLSAILLATLLAIFFALPASAAEESNDAPTIYVEYSGGYSWIPNQRLTGADASGALLDGRVESGSGFNVGGAIGAKFRKYFRAEIAFTYRESEVDAASVQNEARSGSGAISLLAVLVNGYAEYDLGVGVIPYLGLGIGWGSAEIDAKNKAGALQLKLEGRDSVFTWNVMAGGSYPVNDVLDVSLGYRYIATEDTRINSKVRNLGSRRLDSEFDAH